MKTQTADSTMVKYFGNISELLEKTSGLSITVKLSCGWYVPCTKKAIAKVAKSMLANGRTFEGRINMASGGHKWAQVEVFIS